MKRGILAFFLILPHLSAAKALDTLVFKPHWLPQAQFLGYYIAQNKGFYRQAGLVVEIQTNLSHQKPWDSAQGKRPDLFTQTLFSALKQEANGQQWVNIAQFSQQSSLMLITKKSSGIRQLKDLNGKKVAVWNGPEGEIFLKLFQKHGIKPQIIYCKNGINLLTRNAVDAICATYYNEYYKLSTSGIPPRDLQCFALADHGLPIPEDGLYAWADAYHKNPDVYRRFAQASLKGWNYGFNHLKESIILLETYMRQQKQAFSIAEQQWMIQILQKRFINPQTGRDDAYLERKPFFECGRLLGISDTQLEIYYQRMNQTP